MKFLVVMFLAAFACASPVEKREADADPSFPIYGQGYGYPAYYRGYGYPYNYGLRHKRSADPEPEADADPSYLYNHYRPYSVGHSYVRPYTYGHSHVLHKRSAEPEAEASVVYPHTSFYTHAAPFVPYGYPYTYGYGYGGGYGY
ncbi:shematrin-like protein 1 [Penaeus monodon]|uniref:shematrin-like protein 1 n=1 Tax=Penaeus monodon TaxID=6687 RepID=UPI0018A7BFA2|nr:shematrin-like protein 1 [Penaeus monodon]